MFRRLETRGLPGAATDPSTARLLFWDFRAEVDEAAEVAPGDTAPLRWTFSLPAWASGRWSRPEQAAWLERRGLPLPLPNEPRAVTSSERKAITDALAPAAVVSWDAMDARDAAFAALSHGQAAEALSAADTLEQLAPDWVDTRLLKLEVLLGQVRDPDRAEDAFKSLPEGVLDDAAARRVRQSIALLRDDWDSYAAEVAGVMEAGERPWWNFEILGLAYWAAQRFEEALATFDQGMAEHDNRRDLALRRAELLAAMERDDDALAALNRLLAEPEPAPKAWALRGWLRRKTEPEMAAGDYEAALSRDSEEAVARVGRGLQRWSAGDLDGARSDLEPFRYSGWADAWGAWSDFAAATGLDAGLHPSQLHTLSGDSDSCQDPMHIHSQGDSHSHSHGHSHGHGHAQAADEGACAHPSHDHGHGHAARDGG